MDRHLQTVFIRTPSQRRHSAKGHPIVPCLLIGVNGTEPIILESISKVPDDVPWIVDHSIEEENVLFAQCRLTDVEFNDGRRIHKHGGHQRVIRASIGYILDNVVVPSIGVHSGRHRVVGEVPIPEVIGDVRRGHTEIRDLQRVGGAPYWATQCEEGLYRVRFDQHGKRGVIDATFIGSDNRDVEHLRKAVHTVEMRGWIRPGESSSVSEVPDHIVRQSDRCVDNHHLIRTAHRVFCKHKVHLGRGEDFDAVGQGILPTEVLHFEQHGVVQNAVPLQEIERWGRFLRIQRVVDRPQEF